MTVDERRLEAAAAPVANPSRFASVTPSRLRARASSRRARLLLRIAIVMVTLGFVYLAVHGIALGKAWDGLRNSDWWWLAPALVAFGLGNVARALRWRSLFDPSSRPPFPTTLNATMIGYFYNNIMPARAGEAARVMVLSQRSGAPPVETTATVLLERVYDIVGILLIFMLAKPWLPHVSWFGAAAIAAGILAALIAVAVAVLVIYGDKPLRIALRPLHRFAPVTEERVEQAVVELARGLSGLHKRRVAGEALVWTVLAWAMSGLCAYFVAVAFHLHIGLAGGILVMVAIGFGMILPAAPASVGVFEGATLIALRAFGVPRSTGLPYAVVLHLVNFIPFVIVGSLLLQHNARHPPKGVRAETDSADDADGSGLAQPVHAGDFEALDADRGGERDGDRHAQGRPVADPRDA